MYGLVMAENFSKFGICICCVLVLIHKPFLTAHGQRPQICIMVLIVDFLSMANTNQNCESRHPCSSRGELIDLRSICSNVPNSLVETRFWAQWGATSYEVPSSQVTWSSNLEIEFCRPLFLTGVIEGFLFLLNFLPLKKKKKTLSGDSKQNYSSAGTDFPKHFFYTYLLLFF